MPETDSCVRASKCKGDYRLRYRPWSQFLSNLRVNFSLTPHKKYQTLIFYGKERKLMNKDRLELVYLSLGNQCQRHYRVWHNILIGFLIGNSPLLLVTIDGMSEPVFLLLRLISISRCPLATTATLSNRLRRFNRQTRRNLADSVCFWIEEMFGCVWLSLTVLSCWPNCAF